MTVPPDSSSHRAEVQPGGVHLLREVPLGASILWHPSSPGMAPRKPPSGPYPVFVDQKAIAAINGHFEAAGRQGMMGFLVGDLFESPLNHQRYVVIDSTIRLNQAVYGDKTLVIVSRLWDRIQEELVKTEGHLIGWYHSHPPAGIELAHGDVETHLQYFKRPWHVALVLGSEHEGPVAGLFRPKPGETSVSLPFYELIDEAPEGATLETKQSVLPWINYLTDDKAAQHVTGSTLHAVTPPPTPSALQHVKPVSPTPRPSPAVPVSPSGKVSAVRPSTPAPAKPAAGTPTPRPAPAVAAKPAPPPAPPAPAAPLAPAATAQPRPPAAAVSTTGTVARPALGERPQQRGSETGARAPGTGTPQRPPEPGSRTPGPGSPPRRDTQMKSPPNALSNLPIVEAGGYHLGDVDARASEPGVVRPRARDVHPPAAPPPLRRPTVTPKPFAPALAQRRADGHPGLVAFFVLVLLGGGGYAGWKYYLQPRMAASATPAAAASPDTTKHAGGAPQPAPVPATSAPGIRAPSPGAAVDSPLVALDRNADSVTAAVRGYDALVQAGRTGCDGLAQSLETMENSWMRYNVGKKKAPSLIGDQDRFTRDQQLYAAVDSVERDFDRSGCTRP